MEHPEVANEVSSYLENHGLEYQESAEEGAKIYIVLHRSDADFAEMSATIPGLAPWIWPILREIGGEVAVELLKKHGYNAYITSTLEAVNNLSQGDVLSFLGNVLDIVKKVNPALKTLDMTLDGIVFFGKAAKAWKAIEKLKHLGNEFIEKVLFVVKAKAGGVLDKFNWKGGNTGIELFDVDSPWDFWNQLIALFPNAVWDAPEIHALARYKIGQIDIQFKQGGNTNPNGYSIEIKHGNSTPVKIRFK